MGALVALAGWAMVLALALVSRRLAGTWITPFTVLAVPFQAVVTVTIALAEPLGFVAPAPPAVAILLVCTALFWCGEAAVLANAGPLPPVPGVTETGGWLGEEGARPAAFAASWALIGIMAAAFVGALRGVSSLGELVQPQFQARYGTGAAGFARALAMLALVWWLGSTRRWTWREGLTVAGLFLTLFASLVKGTVLLPMVGALLYRALTGRLRFTAWRVGVVVVAGIAVTASVRVIETVVYGLAGLATPSFGAGLVRYVVGYLFAGVLGFSRSWTSGILPAPSDWHVLLAPAWNLAAHLGGFERTPNIATDYLLIDLRATVSGTSNVRTMMGQIYALAGPLGAAAAMLGCGLLFTALYTATRRERNAWLLAVWSLIGAALFFGWFEYYFWHAFWYIAVPPGLLIALGVAVARRPVEVLARP